MSLEERKSLFIRARQHCRDYIQAFHACARENGGALAASCRPLHMAQNLCQGQFFCPQEAAAAQRSGTDAEARKLDACCQAFLTQLKADHAAGKH